MKIRIERCNNVDVGEVDIQEGRLNLKYAINGSGKTTLARAILASVRDRIGAEKESLLVLTSFKHRGEKENSPVVTGAEKVQSVRIFDEKYINEFVFQPDEILKGSFEIFIRGEKYESGMKEIEDVVSAMQKALEGDREVSALIEDFLEIGGSFGKETKSGIHGSSQIAGALKGGNKIINIPAGLEAYKPYIQHKDNYKWVKWQLGGSAFLEVGSDCPYCTNDIKEKISGIQQVSKVYESKSIENLNRIALAFDRLQKYFSEEAKRTIADFVGSIDGYTEDQAAYLREVKSQIDRLREKFQRAQRIGFLAFRDVEKVKDGLDEYRIDLGLFPHLNSEETKKKTEIVNSAVDELLRQAGQLQGLIQRQKKLVEDLVRDHGAAINEFLVNSGYAYTVELKDEAGTGQPKLKLIHGGNEIKDAKTHLSFGERNAFALVLFMHDVLRLVPDLIVLDDPISSFDKNKKYAIIDSLFRRGKGSFREKTVLLLTHDLDPVVDMVVHHPDRFSPPFVTFLQNKNGALSEKEITRHSIKTFIDITRENMAADCHVLSKLVYLRRELEVASNKGMAFQVISNLIHKRPAPFLREENGSERLMTDEERASGTSEISRCVPGFDYDAMIELVNDQVKMIDLYRSTQSNYEKLHIYRILFEDRDDLKNSDVVVKFINEAFHLENNYIYQLNPREFQTVPHFVVEQCNRHVNALDAELKN